MSTPSIEISNISKRYRLGATVSYSTLRDTIAHGMKSLFKRRAVKGGNSESIWALRDVSFNVQSGEALGIIGRNGAGKSTLLKILSRITEPTEGEVRIRGRVGSLLEVGTGFHPELTGRENIFLNGAILGMKKAEMKSKFDEIVAFAEIEKFLDTPVKRYSSGMYVRLAFAVAAHLEPEILLIDEVLAVGDLEFQKKCLGKMSNVTGEGRTVLFVSHNMTLISRLCKTAVWLDGGRVRAIGKADRMVQDYLASSLAASPGEVAFEQPGPGKEAFINSIKLKNSQGNITSGFEASSPINIELAFTCRKKLYNVRIDFVITSADGITVLSTTSWDYDSIDRNLASGMYRVRLTIPGNFLMEGDYYLTPGITEFNVKSHDMKENVLSFKITGSPFTVPRKLGFTTYPFKWRLLGGNENT